MITRYLGFASVLYACIAASNARGQAPKPELNGTWYEDEVDDCLLDSLFLDANGSGHIRLRHNVDNRYDVVHYRLVNNHVLFKFDTLKASFDAVFVDDHNKAADTGDHIKGTFELLAEDGTHKEACSFERQ